MLALATPRYGRAVQGRPPPRPSPAEWQRYRSIISTLYKHHTLGQVLTHMQEQYNFHATIRMYRRHLSDWGQDKNNKAKEMREIAFKAYHQRFNGQEPEFTVRGKKITYDEVERYYKRRGTTIEEVVGLQSPTPTSPEIDSLTKPEKQSSSLSPAVSTPTCFALPEHALRVIQAYIRGSFDAGTWLPAADNEHFHIPRDVSTAHSCELYWHMNRLHCQARLACDLFAERRFQEGGRLLIASTAGIGKMVKASYPPLPTYLPQTIHSIVVRHAPEVALSILNTFAQFAFLFHGPAHPLYRFCNLLRLVDPKSFVEVICAVIAAVRDTFSQTLGPLHRTTLASRYGFVRTLLRRRGPTAVVEGLQEIVDLCKESLPPGDIRTNLAELHLARWLLRSRSLPEGGSRAREIVADIAARAKTGGFDKEAAILLVQAQLVLADHEEGCGQRLEIHNHETKLQEKCLESTRIGEHACVTQRLFWPSLYLYEGKRWRRGPW